MESAILLGDLKPKKVSGSIGAMLINGRTAKMFRMDGLLRLAAMVRLLQYNIDIKPLIIDNQLLNFFENCFIFPFSFTRLSIWPYSSQPYK